MSLILLDLDGTLIGDDGSVTEAVWRGAERLRTHGVRLAVCTGRANAGVALETARRLDAEAPHVFHNGALVTTATGQVLGTTPMGKDALRRMVDHSRRLGVSIEMYAADTAFVDRITPECAWHAEVLHIAQIERDLDDVVAHEEIIHAHWIVEPEQVAAIRDIAMPTDATNRCNFSTATSPALPGVVFISATHATASKGTGAAFAADYLGINLADVTGVGDAHSDVPMLEMVGHPFVMANGDPDVRALFPNVRTVGEDGVLEAFAKMIG